MCLGSSLLNCWSNHSRGVEALACSDLPACILFRCLCLAEIGAKLLASKSCIVIEEIEDLCSSCSSVFKECPVESVLLPTVVRACNTVSMVDNGNRGTNAGIADIFELLYIGDPRAELPTMLLTLLVSLGLLQEEATEAMPRVCGAAATGWFVA